MLKVTFFSNFINHHQIPLSEAFCSRSDVEYTFVATEKVPIERIKMGYPKDNSDYDFVLSNYENAQNKGKIIDLADNSDIVILGSASDDYIINRLKRGKITYRYCERYYRKGWNLKNIPRYIASGLYHHRRFQNKPLYYLCASAYTAGDVNVFSNYLGRQYKFGYFPEIKSYNLKDLIEKKEHNECVKILWVARLIALKHPEVVIEIAEKLKKDMLPFDIDIIGGGEIEYSLRELIQKKSLIGCVHLLGFKTPEEVRLYMEKANIFLFTSDFNEGWGAVVNEAMNSACSVVVSHAVGAAGFLIKYGVNGFVYRYGDVEELYNLVKKLVTNEELRTKLGKNAYETVHGLWNADCAVDRLLELNSCLLKGKQSPYLDGPCSIADNIKEKEMYDYIVNGRHK